MESGMIPELVQRLKIGSAMQGSWVAVKELNLSYILETLLFKIYTHCGNLNPKP